jgi:hypothetical protein
MNDLTLITCSYNTPDITLTMLKSWAAVHRHKQRLLLIDNSTNVETQLILQKNNIPFVVNAGASHGNGINTALDLCKTEYALLVDTDVVLLKSHEDIYEQFKKLDLTLMGKVEGDRGSKKIFKRVNPWHCFINVRHVRKHGISFFNEKKMKDSFKTDTLYDIGSTFLEDVKKAKLKIGDVDLNNTYYTHLEGMSWYKNKFDPSKEDTGIDFGGTHNNPGYVQVYEQKAKIFSSYKRVFDSLDLTDKFII